MKIKDLPEQNRPRERFLKHGPEALSDAELFAILLRTGSKENNVIDMSNKLISEYGLDKLFDCSLKELQQIKGIGPSKAMQILAMAELGKRYSQSKKPVKKINSAKIKKYIMTTDNLLYDTKTNDGAFILLPKGDNFTQIKQLFLLCSKGQ